ncbi:unnamed protein product, partial [Amoebophrya sp. A25]
IIEAPPWRWTVFADCETQVRTVQIAASECPLELLRLSDYNGVLARVDSICNSSFDNFFLVEPRLVGGSTGPLGFHLTTDVETLVRQAQEGTRRLEIRAKARKKQADAARDAQRNL